MMPASKCQLSIRRVAQKWKRERRTGLPLGEGDVPARLVLDEFNLDLASCRICVCSCSRRPDRGGREQQRGGRVAPGKSAATELQAKWVRVRPLCEDLERRVGLSATVV